MLSNIFEFQLLRLSTIYLAVLMLMVRLRSYIKYYYEYLIMNILNDVGKLLIKQTFLYVIFQHNVYKTEYQVSQLL